MADDPLGADCVTQGRFTLPIPMLSDRFGSVPVVNQGKRSQDHDRRKERAGSLPRAGGDLERNHRTAFEADSSQTGAQIIPPVAAIRKYRKAAAISFDAVDVADCTLSAVVQSDVIIKIDQIAEGLRTEINPMAHGAASSVDRHGGLEWSQTPVPRELRGPGRTE